MIRRLQADLVKQKQDFEEKYNKVVEENDVIKESYRRCMNDYIKEKETKETLEMLIKASEENKSTEKKEDKSTPSESTPSTIQNNDTSKVLVCKFFNQARGCKHGTSCKFVHKPMPPCKWGENCRRNSCKFSHNPNANDNNTSFLGTSQGTGQQQPKKENSQPIAANNQSQPQPVPQQIPQVMHPIMQIQQPMPFAHLPIQAHAQAIGSTRVMHTAQSQPAMQLLAPSMMPPSIAPPIQMH